MNELKNSILNSSRLNKHSRPTSVISRRSLTPETQAKKLYNIYVLILILSIKLIYTYNFKKKNYIN